MSFEIERKFLVRNNDWRQHAAKHCDIRQAYLTIGGKASVRVRIRDNSTATLTVKSRPVELRRLELEYPIPMLEAEALMPLRQGSISTNGVAPLLLAEVRKDETESPHP